MARFAAITAFAFLLSRVLGLVREIVISAEFGLGNVTDAYAASLQVPNLLFVLMTGGALSSTFIPMFTRMQREGQGEAAQKMASGITLAVAMGVAVLGAVFSIFAFPIVQHVLNAGQSAYEQQLTVDLLRVVMLQPLFLSLAVIATAILQSYDRFTLPAFAPIAYNVCIILGALLGGQFLGSRAGIFGVAYGVVIGSIIFLLMQVPSAIRHGWRAPTSWPFADPNVWKMFRLVLPRMVGQAAVQVNVLIAISLAAGLGPGAQYAFNISNALALIPVGLFGTSVSTVTFPAMSREAIGSDLGNFKHLLRRSMRSILFLVLPAGIGMLLLREPIISVIYQHGQVTPSGVRLAAEPLLFFSLTISAYALVDVFPRAFYALQDTVTPVKISVFTVGLDILLSFIFVRPFGLSGLALAFAIATTLQAVLLALALRRKIGAFIDRDTLVFASKLVGCTALMAIFLLIAGHWLDGWPDMRLLVKAARLVIVIVVGAGIYFVASYLLRQDEIRLLRRLILRRG